MQEIKREVLVSKASELLKNGTVDRVFGWKKGEFDYDITPALFTTAEDIEKEFVWGDFCGANFSKYLVKETGKSENKVLVFLKPCDTYSFNQLLNEHRFDREKVYAVGVPCNGMLDTGKIKSSAEGIAKITDNGDKVVIETLFDGEITLERNELLPDMTCTVSIFSKCAMFMRFTPLSKSNSSGFGALNATVLFPIPA